MSSSPKSSSKPSQSKKRNLPFRLFGRQKRAKTSPTPYSSSIEEDLKLLRSPLPQIPMLPTLQTQSTGTTPLAVIASPVAYDHATPPTFPFHMPTPTIFHPPTDNTATDLDSQSLSSSEDGSDEYTSPSSHNSHSTLPFPQSVYSQYAYAAQDYQGGITASTIYHASLSTNPLNGAYVNNATGAASMALTQTVTHQHPPQEGGYARHSTTFAYSQSPHHQMRLYTNNSVSITGPNNAITFGPRRQTMQM